MNIYDFTVKKINGEVVSLNQYKGKVLLIVNTAVKCGLAPQYDALESLYQKYREQGLEILDFPCNQFLNQSPGTDEEIQTACTLNFNTTFPRFSKVNVNGTDAHPLYVWLKEQAPKDQGDGKAKPFEMLTKVVKPFSKSSDITWNFAKFLIDRNGAVVGRYSPSFTPKKMEEMVQSCLS